MNSGHSPGKPELHELAKLIRRACLEAARESFKEASMHGLCMDGAMEAALGAIESVDLEMLISKNR